MIFLWDWLKRKSVTYRNGVGSSTSSIPGVLAFMSAINGAYSLGKLQPTVSGIPMTVAPALITSPRIS